MVEDKAVPMDLSPVDPGRLAAYALSPDGTPTCVFEGRMEFVDAIREERKELEISIEYKSSSFAVSEEDLGRYLHTFRNARATPESIVQIVCSDLKDLLRTDNVHVMVTCEEKTVWLGSIE
jgi:hypothetical protein